ncbi:MAG: hypothetical protein L0Z53_23845 [Acidobacteriales bacterium]|nr:hypothetical protein [Terriglobales bacterium]
MQNFILILLLAMSGSLCSGQNHPQVLNAKPKSQLDARVQGLEEKLKDQQFEIDQLKKALLLRDEEIRALTEMIEGDPPPEDDSQAQDDTFEVGTATCRQVRYVRFSPQRYKPGKASRHPVETMN